MSEAAVSGGSTRRVRVESRRTVGRNIDEFVLLSEDGQALPPFSPGAHIDVHPSPGIVRQYSLCGDADDLSRYVIAVLRQEDGRGGSRAVHDELQVGKLLDISAPRQNFPLDESAAHSVLIAGGVGITPLLAMVKHLHKQGRSFELHYRARDTEHAAYHRDLQEAEFAPQVHWHLGERGDITVEAPLLKVLKSMDPARATGTHLYVCGPQGLMTAMLEAGRSSGWAASNLHSEAFAASEDLASGDTFEVTFQRSGKRATVEKNETIIEVAMRLGVEIETSCEQGVCGTCVTRVIAGAVDHRDTYLTDAEHASGTVMTPCCSRAAGASLVLDA